jgi:RNA polymerase sigma-70 factor (ECF subfamily)
VRQHQGLDEDDDAVPTAVIPAPNPEALLLDAEMEKHFAQALDSLSADRKAALLLRVDHGLGYEEIAATMGWTVSTVKNEIHRARLKLRVQLLPHVRGESP